jgi:hypothetical protein
MHCYLLSGPRSGYGPAGPGMCARRAVDLQHIYDPPPSEEEITNRVVPLLLRVLSLYPISMDAARCVWSRLVRVSRYYLSSISSYDSYMDLHKFVSETVRLDPLCLTPTKSMLHTCDHDVTSHSTCVLLPLVNPFVAKLSAPSRLRPRAMNTSYITLYSLIHNCP